MVTPYIVFSGDCRKALDFYQQVFDSPIEMAQPYGGYVPEGVDSPPKDLAEWVLHAEMTICGTKFWFADEVAEPVTKGTMVKLTAAVPTRREAQQIFDRLCAGAQITLPPTETFYSDFHGGLIDQYGVSWNIVAETRQ